MLADRPLSVALRRRGLPAGSPPPARAATEISRMSLVKILPRRASSACLRVSMALRSGGLAAGSPPPARAATEGSRMIVVKSLPRRASSAFLRASMEGPLPMGIQPGTLGKAGILTFREAALAQEGDGLGGGV